MESKQTMLPEEELEKVTGGTAEILADELKGRIIGREGRDFSKHELVRQGVQLHRTQLGDGNPN